jgi:hypothetical protein
MKLAASSDIVTLELHWQQRVPLGELAPYFRGLEAGRAVASHCARCARHWFAPRLECPEHGRAAMGWRELSGRARVLAVTEARCTLPGGGNMEVSLVFALVQAEGACNRALVRLVPELAAAVPGQEVWISRIAAEEGAVHPAQQAHFVARAQDRITRALTLTPIKPSP